MSDLMFNTPYKRQGRDASPVDDSSCLEPEAMFDTGRQVELLLRTGEALERFKLGKEYGYTFDPNVTEVPENYRDLRGKYTREDILSVNSYLEKFHKDYASVVQAKKREAEAKEADERFRAEAVIRGYAKLEKAEFSPPPSPGFLWFF